jgi:type VI secretion system protein VasG
VKALKPELDKIFKPAFLGRMVIIPLFPDPRRGAEADHALKLGKIQRRFRKITRSR